jgi:hypothetical protein
MARGQGSEGWDDVLEDLARRREESRAMGGEERLRKHRDAGKLDVRARIAYLLDAGSFQELGTLVGGDDAPADAVVMGSGRIEGRPVMVAAEDFTVKAGTINAAARDVVDAIAAGPPIALASTKRELDNASTVSLAQALEIEALAQGVNAQTDDLREALLAYMERRPPTFTGR